MESGRISVGVIAEASGAHLDLYLSSLASCPQVEEVTLADKTGLTFEKASNFFSSAPVRFRTFKDPVEMLKSAKPSLALVTLEAHHAPAQIEAALDSNCHVLAEKPACTRIEDFARLVRIADSKHCHLMLAFANRLSPPTRKARELIREGLLGKLYGVSLYYVADQKRLAERNYQQSWFASKARAGGGHLIWLGIHYVDLAQYITGDRIQQVCGFARNVGGQPIQVEDAAVVALLFESGMVGTLHSGYYLDRNKQGQVVVWGSKGWLRFEGVTGTALEWYSIVPGVPRGIQSFSYKTPGGPGSNAYTPLVHAVVDAVRGQQDPPVTGAECLHVLGSIFALYRAAETGLAQVIRYA
jgi:predicted dehydrogenase